MHGPYLAWFSVCMYMCLQKKFVYDEQFNRLMYSLEALHNYWPH